ncbi:hypothetical protein L7F22_067101 [Adiantum nelumboides]|nr:hypothetical protein [Adiantum nelumboides]
MMVDVHSCSCTMFAYAGEPLPQGSGGEETLSCVAFQVRLCPSLISTSDRHSSPSNYFGGMCSSTFNQDLTQLPAACSCAYMHSRHTNIRKNKFCFDQPTMQPRPHVECSQKCTLFEHIHEPQHSHSCMHVEPQHSFSVKPLHFYECTAKQPLNACHCFNGSMQSTLNQASCILDGAEGYGVTEATTLNINVPPMMNLQAMVSPCPAVCYQMTTCVCTIQAQGGVVCALPANPLQNYLNQSSQHCCSLQAAICSVPLQPKCCQLAAHDGDPPERPCFGAPLRVNIPELTYPPRGSALLNENSQASPYMKPVFDTSDHAHQSTFSKDNQRQFQTQVALTDLPLDLAAHTRKLHSVWWGAATSGQASMEEQHKGTQFQNADNTKSQLYKNAQDKNIEDDDFLTLDAGFEQGSKPSDGGCFRNEAHKVRKNCWGERPKNKRRRYFCIKRGNNANTWDGPSASTAGTMSEKPSSLKDTTGGAHGNTLPNQQDCSFQAKELTQDTAGEPVWSFNQAWEEILGFRNKEEILTTTCPSSHAGWMDPYVEVPKVCKEPLCDNLKKVSDDNDVRIDMTSPNARASSDRDEWLQPATKNNSDTNMQSTCLGLEGTSMQREATTIMPDEIIQADAPPEGVNTGEEPLERLLEHDAREPSMTNRAIDFLSSSSDDRELEDDLVYESDDAHFPVACHPTEGDAKSRENQAYEFFMQIFEENEALQKRYKEKHGTGEFDCLVCSNIPNKPIKRYNGLVSVVMHAKKILNTKRRQDHRGFARAVCDFMSCIKMLSKGEGKMVSTLKLMFQLPGQHKKDDDKHFDDCEERDPICSEIKEYEDEDAVHGFENKVMMVDENGLQVNEKNFDDFEHELVGVRDSICSEMTKCEDEDAVQGFENTMTMVDENCRLTRPLEDSTMTIDGNEGLTRPTENSIMKVDEIGALTGPFENSRRMVDGNDILESNVLLADENGIIHGSFKEDKTVPEDMGGRDATCTEMKESEDDDVMQGLFSTLKDNLMIIDESGIIHELIEDKTLLIKVSKGSLATDGKMFTSKVNLYQDEDALQKEFNPVEDIITIPEESHSSGSVIKEGIAVLENNGEVKLDATGQRLVSKCNTSQDEEKMQKVVIPLEDIRLEGSYNIKRAMEDHIKGPMKDQTMPDEDKVERKQFTSVEKISSKVFTCQDANQVGIIINNAENDMASNKAGICLQQEDFHSGMSEQSSLRLEEPIVVQEQPIRAICASKSNDSLVQAESLHDRQDVCAREGCMRHLDACPLAIQLADVRFVEPPFEEKIEMTVKEFSYPVE